MAREKRARRGRRLAWSPIARGMLQESRDFCRWRLPQRVVARHGASVTQFAAVKGTAWLARVWCPAPTPTFSCVGTVQNHAPALEFVSTHGTRSRLQATRFHTRVDESARARRQPGLRHPRAPWRSFKQASATKGSRKEGIKGRSSQSARNVSPLFSAPSTAHHTHNTPEPAATTSVQTKAARCVRTQTPRRAALRCDDEAPSKGTANSNDEGEGQRNEQGRQAE